MEDKPQAYVLIKWHGVPGTETRGHLPHAVSMCAKEAERWQKEDPTNRSALPVNFWGHTASKWFEENVAGVATDTGQVFQIDKAIHQRQDDKWLLKLKEVKE